MTASTRARVLSLTFCERLRTRETVTVETPASFATSAIVGRFGVGFTAPEYRPADRPGRPQRPRAAAPAFLSGPGPAGPHPLTAPLIIPAMKNLCRNRKTSATGRTAMTEAAMSPPQSMEFAPLNSMIAGVIVRKRS